LGGTGEGTDGDGNSERQKKREHPTTTKIRAATQTSNKDTISLRLRLKSFRAYSGASRDREHVKNEVRNGRIGTRERGFAAAFCARLP
jgi:hypothetical protein